MTRTRYTPLKVPAGTPAMSNFNLLGSWVFRVSTDGGSNFGGSNDRYNMSNGTSATLGL